VEEFGSLLELLDFANFLEPDFTLTVGSGLRNYFIFNNYKNGLFI
jgi:hypothetical protein